MQPPEALAYRVEDIDAAPTRRSRALAQLLQDRALQTLLVLTLVVNVALLGYILVRYDALPDPLPLHFDASGLPDRIEAKSGILALPIIGLVVLALDALLGGLVHRHERAASILLATSALLVQLLLWFAMINIAGGLV
jgi:uncharacterized membrane protein